MERPDPPHGTVAPETADEMTGAMRRELGDLSRDMALCGVMALGVAGIVAASCKLASLREKRSSWPAPRKKSGYDSCDEF